MMLGFRKPVSVPPPPAALPLPGPTLHPRMSQSRGLAVSIDCRYIRERPSGIGAYVQALVDRLPALAPAARFQLWVDPRATLPLSPPRPGSSICPASTYCTRRSTFWAAASPARRW